MLRVPRYVLHNIVRRGGVRMPKLVPFRAPYVNTTWHGITGLSSVKPNLIDKLKNDKFMDFENHEFQFWCVRSGAAVCRKCLAQCVSRESRRLHLTAYGCTRALVQSYRRLLPDAKCVMCDEFSQTQKWGVPLCKECEEAWCFQEARPDCVRDALQIVGNV